MQQVRVLDISGEDKFKEELKKLGTDPGGINIMAPKSQLFSIKVTDISLKAAMILKQELLSKGGDVALPRKAAALEGESTDLIMIGTLKIYREVQQRMKTQPFGLAELADRIDQVLESYVDGLKPIREDNYQFEFGNETYVMGILNVTPDSFSDGGEFNKLDAAVKRAKEMIAHGADIIDIGGESTRPGSEELELEKELARVIPIIEHLASEIDVPISIDTYKSEVGEAALEAGADIINDITGFKEDPQLAEVAADYDVPVIVMHIQGRPKNMQQNPTYEDLVSEVMYYLQESIECGIEAGISREKIIIDPGFGFGKTTEHNLELMNRLAEFKSLGQPILIGTSRKSMIGNTLDLPVDERVEGTAATVSIGIANGADIVRVHDVKEMARVAKMTDAMVRR
ncbi:MAG: dihydropteroate synthase [Bacillota bacterium]